MRILSTYKIYVRPPMEQPFNDIRARKLGIKMQQKENWKKSLQLKTSQDSPKRKTFKELHTRYGRNVNKHQSTTKAKVFAGRVFQHKILNTYLRSQPSTKSHYRTPSATMQMRQNCDKIDRYVSIRPGRSSTRRDGARTTRPSNPIHLQPEYVSVGNLRVCSFVS